MLTDTILRYLESHRRLVIPQLGAFVVKDPGGSVLFSELLRRDDGVLRSLLCKEGMTELEAAGAVDRFVFEVRHALQEGQRYPMAGFGELYAAADGTIHFDYAPQGAVRAAAGEQLRPVSDGAESVSPSHPAGEESRHREEAPVRPSLPADVEGLDPHRRSGEHAAASGRKPTVGLSDGRQGDDSRHHVKEVARGAESEGGVRMSRRAHGASDVPSPAGTKLHSDPSVKGLRYGKPVKTTDAYTYVGAGPRRRFDRLIIVAIAAAVVALAAITYGYIRGRQAARADAWAEEWVDETMLQGGGGAEGMPEVAQPGENEESQNP